MTNQNVMRIFNSLHRRGWLDWIPDKPFLKLMFRVKMGQKLNLQDPKKFSEKLQWLKLYDRKPVYTQMVDKIEAKNYVASRLGKEYIVPTLGVWDQFEDIDFDKLPNQFVIKCTHDSGGLVVCRDKSKLDKEAARKKIEHGMATNFYKHGREWPYKNVKPRILAEEFLDAIADKGMVDYKFYCFNGEPKFLYVSQGLEDHSTARISFVSFKWEIEPFHRSDFKDFEELPPKPAGFEEMLELSKKLSKDIPFLRVDFYDVNGKVYFGEMTFFPGAGVTKLDPPKYDEILGSWIKLPEKNK